MQPRLSSSFGQNPEGKQVVSDASPQKNFSPQNREAAEKKLLDWKGVQTRYTFSLKGEEVKEWMEQIIRTQIPSDSPRGFTDQLDDGTILCSLVNELLEGSIQYLPKRSERRVELFLEKCLEIGVAKEQLFEPDDLILHRNTVKVVYCLHSLAEICHQRRLAPFFQGTQQDRTKQRQQWKEQARKSLKTGQGFEGWKVTKLISKIKEDLPLPPASKTTLSVAALPVIDDVVDNVVVVPTIDATSKNISFTTPSTFNTNRTNILENGTKYSSTDDAAGVGLYYSPTASPRRQSPSQSPLRSSPPSNGVSDPMDISNLIPDQHGSMLTTEPTDVEPGPSYLSSILEKIRNAFSSFWKKAPSDQVDVPAEQPVSGTVTPTIPDTPVPTSTANSSGPSSHQSSPLRLPQTPPPSPLVIPSQPTSSWPFSSKSAPTGPPATSSPVLPSVPWTAPTESSTDEAPVAVEPTSTTEEAPSTSFFAWFFSFFFAKKEQQPEELPSAQIETIPEEPPIPVRPSIQVNGQTLNSTPTKTQYDRTVEQPKVVEPVKSYQPIIEQPSVRPTSFLEQPRIVQKSVVAQVPQPTQGIESSNSHSLNAAIFQLLCLWAVGVAVWGMSWNETEAKYGVVAF